MANKYKIYNYERENMQKNVSYCILDSDKSFTPVEYHACCEQNRDFYDKKLFTFIGTGLIFKVWDRIYPIMIRRDFYVRI